MNSNENVERMGDAQSGPSASVVGVFARHYADQRERRAAALAAVLGAADERAGSGPGRPSNGRSTPAPSPFPTAAPLSGSELITLLWRAQLAISLSGLRQLQQQVLLAADYWATLFDVTAALRPDGDRSCLCQDRIVAETRAYLRRVAGVSLQEARALQLELERVGERLRNVATGLPADGLGHVRRSRVKR